MRPLPRLVPLSVLRPTLHILAPLMLVMMLSLAPGGCGDAGTVTSTSAADVDTTVTTEVATTTSPVEPTSTSVSSTVPSSSGSAVASTSSEEVLPNGNIRACGIIREVWDDEGTHKITIDYVDFLTGDEADVAAVADGYIVEGEHVENDYWIRNDNTKLRTFTVSASAVITTDNRSIPPREIVTRTWSEFAEFWQLSGEEAWLSRGPWWIERDGDTVVKIEQQFVP